jgi:DUF4097 and DUF4098 domain-containing protein YvlB
MKYIIASILSLLVILTTLPATEIRKAFPVVPGKELRMDLKTGGSITINGWDEDSVSVIARLRGRDAKDEQVEIEPMTAGVDIRSFYDGHRKNRSSDNDFIITVPSKFDIDIESMGGEISITGVTGNFDGSTMGGELRLTGLKGSIHLRTLGGDISLTKSELDGEVNTNGGSVLLEDVKGNVEGHSLGGPVTYRNVTDSRGKSTGKEIHITTMGGPIKVDEALYGADVSTMGGDIDIRSAAGHVNAKTLGGDITVDAIDGAIDASTLGGDVEVTMTGDPSSGERDVELSSLGGDIRLTVPAGLSMNVDIDIAYLHHHPKIISDFPLNKEERADQDDRDNDLKKHFHGDGVIGGGKYRIKISTIEGDVYLKKGN